MIAAIKHFFATWQNYQTFKALGRKNAPLVVYSEGAGDWPHLGPILTDYLNRGGRYVYCSSDPKDPGLQLKHERVKTFYIGNGTVRTIFFKALDCDVLFTTLPDLEVYELKKSPFNVTYVYAYHSINSTHTVYRESAFEHYDVILCVGPHHVSELRKEEALKGLKPRELLEHGSVKLDTLRAEHASKRSAGAEAKTDKPLALLAPSWGECSIAEDRALLEGVIDRVCQAGWVCRLRLHPMTTRRLPQLPADLRRRFAREREAGLFEVETEMNDNRSLQNAQVLISDWSGVATEFAFALGKPVLFIDTPPKINNPKWERFGMPGLEDTIRAEIGVVVKPSGLEAIGDGLRRLAAERDRQSARIEDAGRRWIFNLGHAAERGAEHLERIVREKSTGTPS